jgi:hypothetical protein
MCCLVRTAVMISRVRVVFVKSFSSFCSFFDEQVNVSDGQSFTNLIQKNSREAVFSTISGVGMVKFVVLCQRVEGLLCRCVLCRCVAVLMCLCISTTGHRILCIRHRVLSRGTNGMF